jgi:hypothetical protein
MSIIACKQVSAMLISNTAAFECAHNEFPQDDAPQRNRETVELGLDLIHQVLDELLLCSYYNLIG